jgi:hypothetical protein
MRPSVVLNLESRAVGAAATMARVACPPRPFWTGCSFNDGARRDRGREACNGTRAHTYAAGECAKRTRCFPRARAENEAAGSVVFDYKDDADSNGRTWKRDRTRATRTHTIHERSHVLRPHGTGARESSASAQPDSCIVQEHGRLHHYVKWTAVCTTTTVLEAIRLLLIDWPRYVRSRKTNFFFDTLEIVQVTPKTVQIVIYYCSKTIVIYSLFTSLMSIIWKLRPK